MNKSILIGWIIFWVLVVAASTAIEVFGDDGYSQYDGLAYEGGLGRTIYVDHQNRPGETISEDYTTFSRWNKSCLTHRIVDNHPELTALYSQAFAEWSVFADVQDCGAVLSGEDITVVLNPLLPYPVLGRAITATGQNGISHATLEIKAVIFPVMAHELGHGLGIGHSELANQLMSPVCCNPFGSDDIAAIQSLYGVKPVTLTPTPPFFTEVPATATPTQTPTPTPAPAYRLRVPNVSRD
jgi:hypothetical protein